MLAGGEPLSEQLIRVWVNVPSDRRVVITAFRVVLMAEKVLWIIMLKVCPLKLRSVQKRRG